MIAEKIICLVSRIGAFAQIPLSGRVAFAPALLYNQKGFSENEEFTDQYGTVRKEIAKVRLNYLSTDLPIRIQNHTQRTTSYLLAGPRVDILLGYKDREAAATYQLYQNIYDQAAQITIGFVTAIGVEFNSNQEAGYFIELEYNPDLTKVYRQPELSVSSTLLALNLGIRLKGAK